MPNNTDPVQFDYATGQRIVRAVRQIEADAGLTKYRRQPPVIGLPFWAKITGVQISGTCAFYSWTAETPKDMATGGGFSSGFSSGFGSSGCFTLFSDGTDTGSTTQNFAREANDFMFVANGAKVLLFPAGNYSLFLWNDYLCNGTTTAAIAKTSSGNVQVKDASSNNQTVTALARYIDLPSGRLCDVRFLPGTTPAYQIEVNDNKALKIVGTLTGTLTAGSSVSCAVSSFYNGDNPGSSLTVYTPTGGYGFTGTSGKHFSAFYDPATDKYYFEVVEC